MICLSASQITAQGSASKEAVSSLPEALLLLGSVSARLPVQASMHIQIIDERPLRDLSKLVWTPGTSVASAADAAHRAPHALAGVPLHLWPDHPACWLNRLDACMSDRRPVVGLQRTKFLNCAGDGCNHQTEERRDCAASVRAA